MSSDLIKEAFAQPQNYWLARALQPAQPLVRGLCRWRCGKPTPVESWRRLLVLGDHHIGDVLYRSASLGRLKHALPHCEIHYCASPVSAPLLKRHPGVDQVHALYRFDSRSELMPGGQEHLQALSFDVALISSVIRNWEDLRTALQLRIPNRIAAVHKGFSGMITHPVQLDYPAPYPALIRQIFNHSLSPEVETGSLRPQVFPGPEHQRQADEFWTRRVEGDRPTIACFPATRQPIATWPADYWVELSTRLDAEGFRVLLMGAESERAGLELVQRACRAAPILAAGELDLLSLVTFLRRCRAALTLDSGPRHLANAAGIPVFFFRNLRSFQIETGVYLESECDLLGPGERLSLAEQKKQLAATTSMAVLKQVLGGIRHG